MIWCLTLHAALAASPEDRVRTLWTRGTAQMAESGSLPMPDLTSRDIRALAAGEVVKQRRREEGSDWAIGLVWLPHSVDAIWVGMVDDAHDELTENLREIEIASSGPNEFDLFQEITLPRPFHTRHWILHIRNAAEVFAQTDGSLWERAWTLQPETDLDLVPTTFLSAHARAASVYTPVNEGGWSLLPDGDATLLVYQARIGVGGIIPDELVVRFAIATIDELLLHVGVLAARAPGHYTGSHEALLRPDLSEIPRF
jgi:hypothetical protein